jgi:hypothetical protein
MRIQLSRRRMKRIGGSSEAMSAFAIGLCLLLATVSTQVRAQVAVDPDLLEESTKK